MNIRQYWDLVGSMPCLCCGAKPVSLHHIRGGSATGLAGCGKKASDWLVLPLCRRCHQDGPQALHNGVLRWEATYGTQRSHIALLSALTGLDLWELARRPAKRSSMTSDKVIPRSEAR